MQVTTRDDAKLKHFTVGLVKPSEGVAYHSMFIIELNQVFGAADRRRWLDGPVPIPIGPPVRVHDHVAQHSDTPGLASGLTACTRRSLVATTRTWASATASRAASGLENRRSA
jgi:hypothetical protein